MDIVLFKDQIQRLRDNYSGNYFTDERVAMIWNAVQNFSDLWFKQAVTKIISSFKHSPTVEDIQILARLQKVRVTDHATQKLPEIESVFSDEERREMWDVMRKATAGLISREQAIQYACMVYDALEDRGVKMDYSKEQVRSGEFF